LKCCYEDALSGYEMVKTAVLEVLPRLAEMVEDVLDFTVEVLTVNVDEFLPAGIVTVAGTVAEEPVAANAITRPAAGAAEVMVAVPVLDFPPTTVVGLSVSDFNVGAVIVSVAVFELLPSVAVSIATV